METEPTNEQPAPSAARDAVAGASAMRLERSGTIAFGLIAFGWLAVLARYVRAPIALSPDSMNNYAHVWWIGDGLFHHGVWRFAMPVLGHGAAITYPYGFVNWTTASLVWPIFGDYATTMSSVVGAAGCIIASWVAFPELRRSWWGVALLLNPAIIDALLFGQQSFAWAAMLFIFGIAAWRRDRRWLATALVGLAQLNHAAVVLPMGVVVVALWWRWEPDRRALLRHYAATVAFALPAVFAVLTSDAYVDSSVRDRAVNFFSTLGPRVLVVVLPMGCVLLARRLSLRWAPIIVCALLVANLLLAIPLHGELAWRTLARRPRAASMRTFLRSTAFRPGRTYRVLRGGDAKLGAYLLLKAGGRLDSEFFPESAAMRSFPNGDAYESLLCDRHIDIVIAFHSYDVTRKTNEHAILTDFAREPDGSRASSRVSVSRIGTLSGYEGYDAFAISRRRC